VCRIKSELSPLKYIDVQMCGDNFDIIKVTSGLIDSGSEITCVRADLVNESRQYALYQMVMLPMTLGDP